MFAVECVCICWAYITFIPSVLGKHFELDSGPVRRGMWLIWLMIKPLEVDYKGKKQKYFIMFRFLKIFITRLLFKLIKFMDTLAINQCSQEWETHASIFIAKLIKFSVFTYHGYAFLKWWEKMIWQSKLWIFGFLVWALDFKFHLFTRIHTTLSTFNLTFKRSDRCIRDNSGFSTLPKDIFWWLLNRQISLWSIKIFDISHALGILAFYWMIFQLRGYSRHYTLFCIKLRSLQHSATQSHTDPHQHAQLCAVICGRVTNTWNNQ